jgi:flavin reductase (DIM6/NTAB) family NADH-FMN oxidoreductase RutF
LHWPVATCYKIGVISPDDFRRVLSHFASGVTIVTTVDANHRPTGLTASAFTSVSLEPPLILVCVAHSSQSYPALVASGRFAVNFLRADQQEASRRFATSKIESAAKFDGVPYRLGSLGLPLLDEALAYVECVTANRHEEGDHTVFIGRVEACGTTDGAPLLYFRGKYASLSPGA